MLPHRAFQSMACGIVSYRPANNGKQVPKTSQLFSRPDWWVGNAYSGESTSRGRRFAQVSNEVQRTPGNALASRARSNE